MPYTIKKYVADNKEEKRAKFREKFSPRVHDYPNKRVLMDCPLTNDIGMDQLIATSTQLLYDHPDATRFVALGRTPLRILQAASLQEEGLGKQFGYAAFSGRFARLDMSVSKPRLQLSEKDAPTSEQLTAYKLYLNDLGLHPIRIIQDHSPLKPLVIVEAITSGGGLFSFLTLLHNWATESLGKDAATQLRACVRLHVLIDDTAPRHPNCMIHSEAIIFGGFPLTQHKVANNLLGYLFESAEVFNDSLGKPYPVKDWSTHNVPPAMGKEVSPEADLLSFRIIDYMAERDLIPALRSASSAPTLRQRRIGGPSMLALEVELPQQNCCQWLSATIARAFGY